MKFTDAISVFDLHLGAERNVSPNTRRAYRSDVRQLAEFAGEDSDPAKFSIMDVRADLASLHKSRHPATLGRKLAAIRSFFRCIAVLVPDHANQVMRVLDIPPKRFDRRIVDFLSQA